MSRSVTGTTRSFTATLAALLLTLFGVALAIPAQAGTDAYLRTAHLSPDTPDVDIYIVSASDPSNQIVLNGVGYGSVTDYRPVPQGTYTVSMRPAGADPSTPPVISTTLNTAEGKAYTVAGVGSFNDLGLTVLRDDLTLPPSGQSRVRVIQASASQPKLNISVDGGPSLGADVAFASTTPYETVAAGTWTLRVDGGTGLATTLPFKVEAGAVYSVLILDSAQGGLTVLPQVDAASPTQVPTGSVETGFGGTAGGGVPMTLLLAAVVTALGAALVLRRRAAIR